MPTLKSVDLRHEGGMLFRADPSSGHAGRLRRSVLEPGRQPGRDDPGARSGRAPRWTSSRSRPRSARTIEQYEIHVKGSQRDEYPQVFTEIDVVHEFVGRDLSEAALRRCIELSATKYCPVNAMISAGATVVHHRYQIWSLGDEPFDAQGEVLTTGPYARPSPGSA